MTTQRHVKSELLTVAEAAGELRLNAETVKRALRSGALPGVRLNNGPWRILPDDLRALRTSKRANGHRRRGVPADLEAP
jgi:excisionase family DNA binding protein